MKKSLCLLLAAVFFFGLLNVSPAKAEARAFTDSLGREIALPEKPERVAVSGAFAQIVLFSLCPDLLVGISNAWDKTAVPLLDEKYLQLPVLGQLYGGKGELNLEALLASGAEIVVDVGEAKKGAAEDLDALSEQTGIPFVHIDASTATMGDAYRKLGELLGMQEEASVLADYCDSVWERMNALTGSVEKKTVLYVLGDSGLNVIAKGSYHAEIIDMLGDNAAVVESPSAKGTGNETDVEQLLLWDPEVIFFAPDSICGTAADDPVYSMLSAIRNGTYYQVPDGPYNWFGFPPSVQRIAGFFWGFKVLYPEAADYNLYEELSAFFRLFFHFELTKEQYTALTGFEAD